MLKSKNVVDTKLLNIFRFKKRPIKLIKMKDNVDEVKLHEVTDLLNSVTTYRTPLVQPSDAGFIDRTIRRRKLLVPSAKKVNNGHRPSLQEMEICDVFPVSNDNNTAVNEKAF